MTLRLTLLFNSWTFNLRFDPPNNLPQFQIIKCSYIELAKGKTREQKRGSPLSKLNMYMIWLYCMSIHTYIIHYIHSFERPWQKSLLSHRFPTIDFGHRNDLGGQADRSASASPSSSEADQSGLFRKPCRSCKIVWLVVSRFWEWPSQLTFIFFRGVAQPPTSCVSAFFWW